MDFTNYLTQNSKGPETLGGENTPDKVELQAKTDDNNRFLAAAMVKQTKIT
jgi:hypothetical protein